jgi:uncharacterized protein (DUF4415 family)
MTAKSPVTPQPWVDPDDAPELGDDFFIHADEYRGETLVRRGRPRLARPKEAINLRVDPDVLAHFRASGKGWQSRMNEVLRRAAGLSGN